MEIRRRVTHKKDGVSVCTISTDLDVPVGWLLENAANYLHQLDHHGQKYDVKAVTYGVDPHLDNEPLLHVLCLYYENVGETDESVDWGRVERVIL